ncbi:MAG: trypsin-like serine protease [Nannocystaceae bacterium]
MSRPLPHAAFFAIFALTPTLAHAGDKAPRWFSLQASSGTERIVGGEPTNTCEWPTTVSLGDCTGTLVHPRVVIYAAHCGANVGQVRLGEKTSGEGRVAATEKCEVNPAYGTLAGTDHAYCVLVERHEQPDVPLVPILMGCETDALLPGAEVTIVGFGQDDNGNLGTKRKVTTTVNSVADEISIGSDGKDSCYGDSGGPVYIKLEDGAWRVFGITSYGITADCGPGGMYSMMHLGMPWLEGQLAAFDIDLTACHNSDGEWNPGPDCKEFPLQAETGFGSWDNGCSGGTLSGYSTTCGDGFDQQPPDLDPPTVAITTPVDGQRIDGVAPYDLEVLAAADDGDGYGVDDVRLVIDGSDLADSADESAPYEWTVQLADGMHILAAVATDEWGNETVSESVTIGINTDVVIPPEPTTGSDTSGGATGATDPGGDDGNDDNGCGCRVDHSAPWGASFLFGLTLLAIRRRT